jgi:hypothetical protein
MEPYDPKSKRQVLQRLQHYVAEDTLSGGYRKSDIKKVIDLIAELDATLENLLDACEQAVNNIDFENRKVHSFAALVVVKNAVEYHKAQAALRDSPSEEVERLRKSLENLLEAEWMVTHDWGGDRATIIKEAEQALKG